MLQSHNGIRAQTQENVAMADELVLSHEETNSSFNTPSSTVCCYVDHFFMAILA